ncbi:transposase, MuDR, MULE transposase domain protein [Tanacetum coccineum]
MSEDLTYSSLHEMMMKKFKFESNSQINLSFKLSSFDCNVDITDDAEPDIPETPVYKSKPMISKQYSQQSEVKKGKNFDNKEDLMLAVRLKALNDGFQFLTDRSRVLKGKDIQQDILSKYKIHISYQQAWRGKDYAIQQIKGSPYEAFEMLSYYCFNLERKNEGTITRIKTDENEVFEMLFIGIGASIRTFRNYLRPVLMIDAAHLKGLYKGTNLVAVAMDGNNQTVLIAFGICKRETGPCWTWWVSVLKECIGDNPNLLFISDRHAVIALAVENEFPLAFHAKRACVKVSETYHAMVQEWYYKRRQLAENMTYEITDWAAHKVAKKSMKSATWVVKGVNPYQYEVSDGQYIRVVNLQTGICECRKWQLSGIPCGHVIAVTSNPEQVRLNVLTKLQEAIDEEAILKEQILALMQCFADRFTDRRVEINNLMVLHDHPLIDYGKYALGCMTGADMKKCVHLKSVKDELLRSMEEKRQLMENYRDM